MTDTGTIDDACVREIRTRQVSDQATLTSFDGNETAVGIVQSSNEYFDETVDENDPRLAPPEELFFQWLSTREKLEESGGTSEAGAHNRAYEIVDYEARFIEHLATDPEAQAALDELAERVQDGETITLVCFCGRGRECHRSLVKDALAERVDDNE